VLRFRRPRPAEAAVLTAAFLAGGIALWACGPFFPNWILGPDEDVLTAPQAMLRAELDRLAPAEEAPFPAKVAEDPDLQTAEADTADLAAALEGISPERRQALVERLRAFRQDLGREGQASPPVPQGLPGEFEEYLRGAVAWWEGRTENARAHWRRLLDRPAAERRFRSTWAAFMLGKGALEAKEPDEAGRWFRRTRELAAAGFADSLGLASSSLGWEARAERDRGRLDEALRLYLQQDRSGDPSGFVSLRWTAGAALKQGREALLPLAQAADTRQIMTSYVLSRYGVETWDGIVDESEARAWIEVVAEAGARDLAGADRLAWAAYVAGDFAAAEKWLEAAPEDSPMAKWVRAKLLLRAGKLEEAEKLLAEVSRTLPEVPLDESSSWDASRQAAPLPTPLRAAGEEGAVRLSRREYGAALDAFLRGGYELDAAYVAERILTVDELRAHVDARWPAEFAVQHDLNEQPWVDGGLLAASDAETAYDLRNLLGRRLVRAGRYEEALPYLPEPFREKVKTLAAALKVRRADTLFQAACILRHDGMEILGTELEPDWFAFYGQYDPGFIVADRERRRKNKLLRASADEAARVERHRVEPGKRFHYRYQAAEIAWDAASMLPDGSEEKARILAVAGTWLAFRDPQAADRFYKALVRCCRNTDLGREADELRWFPEVGGCQE
jgi:tetratricopeptide (TPR) repeat protein